MAQPCERCKRVRYQITLIFGALILVNFLIRVALSFETKTIQDLLLLPSSLTLVFSVLIVLLTKRRVK